MKHVLPYPREVGERTSDLVEQRPIRSLTRPPELSPLATARP